MSKEGLTYIFKEKKGTKEKLIKLFDETLVEEFLKIGFIELKKSFNGKIKWYITDIGKKMYLVASGEYKKINTNSFSFKFSNFIRRLRKKEEFYF